MSLDFSAGIGSGRGSFMSPEFNTASGLSASLVSPQLTNSGPQIAPTQVADLNGISTPVGIHPGNGKIFPQAIGGGLIVDITGNSKGVGFVNPGWPSSTIKGIQSAIPRP